LPRNLTEPIALEYDIDIFSYNNNREDGYINLKERSQGFSDSFDGKGGTYPAEMIGDTVQLGNTTFAIGSREEGVHI
jgi:hypothetical protein